MPIAATTGSAAGTHVRSVPADLPFVDALAAGLRQEVGDDPLALANTIIFLPRRRAIRSLSEAFLRLSDGQPILLPRMHTLGDADADDLTNGDVASALPVPVSELARLALLSRLILSMPGHPPLPAHAIALARALAAWMDEVETEELAWSGLAKIVPDDLAKHWQITLSFLQIITDHWPVILQERQMVTGAFWRRRVLEGLTAQWTSNPPPGRIIIAGTPSLSPAIIRLVAAVRALPQGLVVLDGLCRQLDEDAWDSVGTTPSHPQHALWHLLNRLDLRRDHVPDWRPIGIAATSPKERVVLLAEAMRPASATDQWLAAPKVTPAALDGLRLIECAGPEEEALCIALLLRETLETPGRTAALITPDQPLARRVAAALSRWSIAVDVSAGQALPETTVGVYLRLVAEVVTSDLAPIPLLSLLKHPLAALGRAPKDLRSLTRKLELAVLRGPRLDGGMAGLRQAVQANDPADPAIGQLLEDLETVLSGLFQLMQMGTPQPTSAWLHAHMTAAEALAGNGREPGPACLWKQDDGVAAAGFARELMEVAAEFPAMTGADYLALFTALAADVTVRPRFGMHPRLAILGLLEARLQRFDRVILGGLNEGVWPAPGPVDPWMSRPMRRAFGLPASDSRIGMAANDFASAALASDVFLVRSQHDGSAPRLPSRWLARIDTVLQASGLSASDMQDTFWLPLARVMDQPAAVEPCRPPEPKPPLAARPRRLSVSGIEQLRRDPYGFYAQRILKLRALQDIDEIVGPAERGTLIHDSLYEFLRAGVTGEDSRAALARLLATGKAIFQPLMANPEIATFWWPRFVRIARWFTTHATQAQEQASSVLALEVEGQIPLQAQAGEVVLTARADRIDQAGDGSLTIIDYKTGRVPTQDDVEAGYAPQLPLEALIASKGGFKGVPATRVGSLEYWQLSGAPSGPGKQIPLKADIDILVDTASKHLEILLADYYDHNPTKPYLSVPIPAHAPAYNDYEQLARIAEWAETGHQIGKPK